MGLFLSCCIQSPSPTSHPSTHPHTRTRTPSRSISPFKRSAHIVTTDISPPLPLGTHVRSSVDPRRLPCTDARHTEVGIGTKRERAVRKAKSASTLRSQIVRFDTPPHLDELGSRSPTAPTPDEPGGVLPVRRKTCSLPSSPRSQRDERYSHKRQLRVDEIPFPLRVSPPRSLRYGSPTVKKPGLFGGGVEGAGGGGDGGAAVAAGTAGYDGSDIRSRSGSRTSACRFAEVAPESDTVHVHQSDQKCTQETSIHSRLAQPQSDSGDADARRTDEKRETRRKLRKVHRVEGDWELWQPDDWGGTPGAGKSGRGGCASAV